MLEKTISIIKKLEESGYSTDAGNAKLFFPIEELRGKNCSDDKNFLCEMYPSLSDEEIAEYSSYYNRNFPEELKQLYKYTNGIRIIDRFISIGGLEPPNSPRPNHDGRVYTPIHWVDTWGNSPRDKKYWGDGKLFFAWYNVANESHPHKYVYMDCTDTSLIKSVNTCYAGSEEVLESWPSFDEWFSSEYQKYMEKFNNKDYRVISVGGGILNILSFT